MSKKAQLSATAMISQALGLTKRRVQQLRKQGMPATVEGARKWMAEHVDSTQAKHTGSESLQRLRDAKAASAEIEHRLNRLKVAKLEGAVIDFAVAQRVITEAIEIQRAGFRQLEGLYAQAFAMTAAQREEWNQKWNTQEQQISAKISALQTALRS